MYSKTQINVCCLYTQFFFSKTFTGVKIKLKICSYLIKAKKRNCVWFFKMYFPKDWLILMVPVYEI